MRELQELTGKLYANSHNHALPLWWTEKHIRMHNLLNLEAATAEQEQEQETEWAQRYPNYSLKPGKWADVICSCLTSENMTSWETTSCQSFDL